MPASIEFTESGGILRALVSSRPGPSGHLSGFVPDAEPMGPSRPTLATGELHRWTFRTDYRATFAIPGIGPEQLETAQKLRIHLLNGGTATLVTDDAADRRFTIRLAPESVPSISGPDDRYEYTFQMTALNTAASPLLCNYDQAALILRAGDELTSFSRASVATYRDSIGKLVSVATGSPRMQHYPVSGVRSLLLENGTQNWALRSEEMGNGAIWTAEGLATVTDNDPIVRAPDWTQTADRLVEDTSTGNHRVYQAITITSGEICTASVWVRGGSRDRLCLQWGTGADVLSVFFNTTTGVITLTDAAGVSQLTRAYVETWPNGWYRLVVAGAINGGNTTGHIILRLLDASGNQSYTGDGSGAYFWGAQVERSAVMASSYMRTEGSSVSRSDELVNVTVPFGPQAMWVYHRFRELGTIFVADRRAWHLGTTAAPCVFLYRESTGKYGVRHHNGGVATEVPLTVAPALFDEVEILVVLDANGRPDIYQSLNRGTPTSVVGGGTSIGFTTAWGSNLLWLGSDNGVASNGWAAHERLVVGRGSLGSGANLLMAKARGIAG